MRTVVLSLHEPLKARQDVLAAQAISVDAEGRFCQRWLQGLGGESFLRYDTIGRLRPDGVFYHRASGHFELPRLRASEDLLEAVVGGDLLEGAKSLSFEVHKNGLLALYDQADEYLAYVNNQGQWEVVSGWHLPGPEILVCPSGSFYGPPFRPLPLGRPSALAEAGAVSDKREG